MASSRTVEAPVVGPWERAGAFAVWLESALVIAGSAVLAVAWVRDGVESPAFAVTLEVFAVAVAVGLAYLARGLWRGSRWPRGAALVWQAIQLAVAFGSDGAPAWLVVLLAVPAAVAVAGVFSASLRTQREGAATP